MGNKRTKTGRSQPILKKHGKRVNTLVQFSLDLEGSIKTNESTRVLVAILLKGKKK